MLLSHIVPSRPPAPAAGSGPPRTTVEHSGRGTHGAYSPCVVPRVSCFRALLDSFTEVTQVLGLRGTCLLSRAPHTHTSVGGTHVLRPTGSASAGCHPRGDKKWGLITKGQLPPESCSAQELPGFLLLDGAHKDPCRLARVTSHRTRDAPATLAGRTIFLGGHPSRPCCPDERLLLQDPDAPPKPKSWPAQKKVRQDPTQPHGGAVTS